MRYLGFKGDAVNFPGLVFNQIKLTFGRSGLLTQIPGEMKFDNGSFTLNIFLIKLQAGQIAPAGLNPIGSKNIQPVLPAFKFAAKIIGLQRGR